MKVSKKFSEQTTLTSKLNFPSNMIVDFKDYQLFDIESTLLDTFRSDKEGNTIFQIGVLLGAFIGKENAHDLMKQAHDLVWLENSR